MKPIWWTVSVAMACLAGFFLPIVGLIFFLGVMELGPIAITGLIALAGAMTLIVLAARGRLRI